MTGTDNNINRLCLVAEKAVAMYELLHAHAQGRTDLTEDQLANVVTGVADEARDALRAAVGGPVGPPGGWIRDALRGADTVHEAG